MKYVDVMTRVLAEVSGKPEEEIKQTIDLIRERQPVNKLDVELPPEEAEQLLKELRAESSGILNWLLRGAAMVGRNTGHA